MLKNVLDKIHILAAKIGREVKIMEVCGTHTQVIAEFGLRSKMPENIKLITGPGCPVCVTDQKDIDSIIALARAGVPIATYGDLLRVPGSAEEVQSSKFKVQSQLADTPQSLSGDCGGAGKTLPLTPSAGGGTRGTFLIKTPSVQRDVWRLMRLTCFISPIPRCICHLWEVHFCFHKLWLANLRQIIFRLNHR